MFFEEFTTYKDQFLQFITVERNLSTNTLKSYKSDLDLFTGFWIKIQEPEPKKVPFRRALERYFVNLFHQKIDTSSVARKISCFKSVEHFLKNQGITIDLKLKRPRVDKKLPTYLTVDEIFYLLDGIKDEQLPSTHPVRDKAIFELLYATGIRCSELCAIKMQDIDLHEKVIKIQGKGNKERYVLFGKKAQERLNEYLEKERPTVHEKTDPLFVSHVNEQLNQRTVQRVVKMFRTFLTGNKNITPHKIRHSFATHLLNQGADLRIVQELLGHATLATTEKYTHVTNTQLQDMCDALHPINDIKKIKI